MTKNAINILELKQTLLKSKDLNGVGSGSGNIIMSVGNGLLLKKFVLPDACMREFLAANLSSEAAPFSVPQAFLLGNSSCLIEEIPGSLTAADLIDVGLINMGEVCSLIEKFKQNLKNIKESPAGGFLSWENFLSNLQKSFNLNKAKLQSILCKNTLEQLGDSLVDAIYNPNQFGKTFLLHRDLHLSNILVRPDGSMFVIDFEQAVFGPLGFEFQNSIFWNDEKSIDLTKLSDEVKGQTSPILADLYVIDQLLKALEKPTYNVL